MKHEWLQYGIGADPVSVSTRRIPRCANRISLRSERSGPQGHHRQCAFPCAAAAGFALEGLVIYDDPDFSANDDPRRGCFRRDPVSFPAARRLEIATLSANEPSINLVRNNQGRWNLASLLERNAQIPAPPTAKNCIREPPGIPLSRSQQRPPSTSSWAKRKNPTR